jgi:hypothetical protein
MLEWKWIKRSRVKQLCIANSSVCLTNRSALQHWSSVCLFNFRTAPIKGRRLDLTWCTNTPVQGKFSRQAPLAAGPSVLVLSSYHLSFADTVLQASRYPVPVQAIIQNSVLDKHNLLISCDWIWSTFRYFHPSCDIGQQLSVPAAQRVFRSNWCQLHCHVTNVQHVYTEHCYCNILGSDCDVTREVMHEPVESILT